MTTHHDPDTVRAWATVALSWTGTGAAWALDNAGPIAALVSVKGVRDYPGEVAESVTCLNA